MRIIIFLLLFIPAAINAQINRSAREFAEENIQEYLTGKLFKGQSYKPISFGELKPRNEKNSDAKWILEHKFEIAGIQVHDDKKTSVQKSYKFMFYLDEKMKVLMAEAY